MKWIIICIGSVILFPIFIYFVSKAQMLGWIEGLSQFMEKEIRDGKKDTKEEK